MKNWRTTAVGIIGAIVNTAYPLITQGIVSPETIIISVILAVLGYLAKDFKVSGIGQ